MLYEIIVFVVLVITLITIIVLFFKGDNKVSTEDKDKYESKPLPTHIVNYTNFHHF